MHTQDVMYPINLTTQEETPDGMFSVKWVVDEDGGANGFDEKGNRWEAMFTGESIIEARNIKS